MAAGFPSVYCQVRAAGSRLSFRLLPGKMQLVRLSHQLSGSRLSFHPLPGKGHLAAGFLTCYMAAGFPFVYCQVRGSWQQAFSIATWQQAFLSSIAR
jgi:hypothetical protein